MAEKGYVEYYKQGRAFIYSATITEQQAQQSALKTLINRLFGGSSTLVTQQLIQQEDIDLSELEKLQAKIDEKVAEAKQNKDPNHKQ